MQAKDDPYDSTRMKKELPKSLKALNPGLLHYVPCFYFAHIAKGDRVIIVGTSSSPFNTDMKAFAGLLPAEPTIRMMMTFRIVPKDRPCPETRLRITSAAVEGAADQGRCLSHPTAGFELLGKDFWFVNNEMPCVLDARCRWVHCWNYQPGDSTSSRASTYRPPCRQASHRGRDGGTALGSRARFS